MISLLGTVFFVSLSGVVAPGPVFAVSMARGLRSPFAGSLIAVGHALVEIPLVLLIANGLASWLQSDATRIVLGIAGGSLLCWMGYQTLTQLRCSALPSTTARSYSTIVAGMVTTAANPYFFIWWATIGSLLFYKAQTFGLVAVILFMIVHLSTDFIWYSGVSIASYKSWRFHSGGWYKGILVVAGLVLVCFGLFFLVSGLARAF